MEEESGQLLRAALPEHWVVHGYSPDYGIDGTVEIFEYIDDDQEYAESLGETFFFQLKSTKKCAQAEVKISTRANVEKSSYVPGDDHVTMRVVRYNFRDTDELATIEAMGAGVVVVLFLACLDCGRVFFVSLTDLIEKVLTPESPGWRDQNSKVIYIPASNEVAPDTPLLTLLRFYGLRPKLMGLFTKVHFQWAELEHGLNELTPAAWQEMAQHFTENLLRPNVWDYCGWGLLHRYKDQLQRMRRLLAEKGTSAGVRRECMDLWFGLDALGRTFEDVAREWGLPTALGQLAS